MRVMHLYSGNLWGGIEAVLLTFARERDSAPEMRPVFVLAFDGRLAGELRTAGAEVHVLSDGVRLSRPWTVWRARRWLRALLAAHPVDVAVAHAPWAVAVFGRAVRRAGVPLVFYAHDAAGAGDRVERAAARTRPDAVIANSTFTELTLPLLYPGVPSRVLTYPVPAPEPFDREQARRRVRAELQTGADDVVFAQVGRMEAWKGQFRLLEALAALREVPGWTAWLVGGAQRPAEAAYALDLHSLAARLGIADRVRFAGQRGDVAQVLAAADVACQPNAAPEPFGVAVVEALHAGVPVVATAAGGAQEIVTAECGILVPPGDVEALAAALRLLMEDEGARLRLGAAGPARARAVSDPGAQLGRLAEALEAIRSDARPGTR